MTLYALDDSRPQFPDSGRCWVAPNATLIGKVRLGEDASVWFAAVLRGDNELIDIGARANIQDGCILHTDMGFPLVVGEGCTIGHMAMLHGCIIAPGSLIGMGATVLNGARIGADSSVGAGALVPEGKEIPSGVLAIGAPARVVRSLNDSEITQLDHAAEHYVENHRRFSSGLAEIAEGAG
jgi:carbonic anhydrase/acetyltransferase-like protein (isoleucine patch superfamily)